MKKALLPFALLIAGLMPFCYAAKKTDVIKKDKKVEITFNPEQTLDDLIQLREKLMHKYGIKLDYTTLTFDDYKHLTDITFTVDCGDGFKGSAGTKHLSNLSPWGFYRDYNQHAKVPFATGLLQ